VKKFVIAVAAVFALACGAGTASAGYHHNNVQVVNVVRHVHAVQLVGGVDTCGHDNVAVVADDYVAPVQVRRVVNANAYDYNNVTVVNGRYVGGRGIRGGFRAVRADNGGNSGVVGALKVVGRTVGNLIGDIIGN
jgi:hypothetical protein